MHLARSLLSKRFYGHLLAHQATKRTSRFLTTNRKTTRYLTEFVKLVAKTGSFLEENGGDAEDMASFVRDAQQSLSLMYHGTKEQVGPERAHAVIARYWPISPGDLCEQPPLQNLLCHPAVHMARPVVTKLLAQYPLLHGNKEQFFDLLTHRLQKGNLPKVQKLVSIIGLRPRSRTERIEKRDVLYSSNGIWAPTSMAESRLRLACGSHPNMWTQHPKVFSALYNTKKFQAAQMIWEDRLQCAKSKTLPQTPLFVDYKAEKVTVLAWDWAARKPKAACTSCSIRYANLLAWYQTEDMSPSSHGLHNTLHAECAAILRYNLYAAQPLQASTSA